MRRTSSLAYSSRRRAERRTRIFEDDGGSCQLGSRLLIMLYIFNTATSTCGQGGRL